MPTGYTASVQDGTITEFKSFAWTCARAFGALINMRDDPMDAAIDLEQKPSTFYAEKMVEAEKLVAELVGLSSAECEARAHGEAAAQLEQHAVEVERARVKRNRYQSMLDKVNSWVPPTADHINLKKFMVEQLEQSIAFDCKVYTPSSPCPRTWEAWRSARLVEANKAIQHYAEENRKELERTASRNAWLRALNESLKGK